MASLFQSRYTYSPEEVVLTLPSKYIFSGKSIVLLFLLPILMNLARDLSDYFQFFGRKLHIVIFLALSKAFSAGLKAFP